MNLSLDCNFGGKANSLIKLKKMNLPVPDFFVVPASYFKEYVLYNNLSDKLNQMLKEKNFTKIKDCIKSGKFPANMAEEIRQEASKIKATTFSIRSSANNEDGQSKSFAGQYETYLNVSKENIFKNILNCWTSIFEDNVLSYIEEDCFDIYSINVVVQEMVNPDFAGVAFSLDPTSRSKNYSFIEAVKGLGEKLVSGKLTPTKYFIRRQNKEIDFVSGEKLISNSTLQKLEELLLKIENSYGYPVDVEWCVLKEEIFILQARPITAFFEQPICFKKILTREHNLFELQIYHQGEYDGIKALTNGLYYFNPLFNFTNNKVEIYYDFTSLEESPNSIFREIDKDYNNFYNHYQVVKLNCEYLKSVIYGNCEFELKRFLEIILSIQPFSSLGNSAGQGWTITDRVKKIFFEYREKFDKLIYISYDFLAEKLYEILPQARNYLNVLTLDEILEPNKINIDELKTRQKGYVLYDGQIHKTDFSSFLKSNNFVIKENEHTNANTGSCAYGGQVRGKVKVILSNKDFDKFKDGDILVTNMTTPKFTSIMKKASAILTDEGGVTCHASIVARELRVPCLVGCGNVTELLKDGDIVFLDADKCEWRKEN